MKKIYMPEFKELCDCLKPNKFIYNTRNQEYDLRSEIALNLVFDEVSVNTKLNAIFLRARESYARIDRIRHIMWEECPTYNMFSIVCNNKICKNMPESNVIYVIIAK